MTSSIPLRPGATSSLLEDIVYCRSILPAVSRSFALGIQVLRGQVHLCVLVGYLLCRIADTIEDDVSLLREQKCTSLQNLSDCFDDVSQRSVFGAISSLLQCDTHHSSLVKQASRVFSVFDSLSKNSQLILKKWIMEMIRGMMDFTKRYPQGIRIKNIEEYQEYCYFVAGTVGHMLTDLWGEYGYFISQKKQLSLHQKAGLFGEALQSVNILKDAASDFKNANAVFIPKDQYEAQDVSKLIALTEQNLQAALEYVYEIPYINFNARFFCIFPLLMAFATMKYLKSSAGILLHTTTPIKVPRQETKQIYKRSFAASLSNRLLLKFSESA